MKKMFVFMMAAIMMAVNGITASADYNAFDLVIETETKIGEDTEIKETYFECLGDFIHHLKQGHWDLNFGIAMYGDEKTGTYEYWSGEEFYKTEYNIIP